MSDLEERKRALAALLAMGQDDLAGQASTAMAPAVGAVGQGVGHAAQHWYNTIDRWQRDPSLPSSRGDTDIGADAFMMGPGTLMPQFGGATKAALGVAGGKVLQRQDAQKLVRQLAQAGKTDKEITAALNERFAPIIDEGTEINRQAVMRSRLKQDGGDFELGVLGGAGKNSRITPDDVTSWMRDAGVPIRQVKTAGPEGTTYIKYNAPGNPPRPGESNPQVRVPTDEMAHIGRPARPSQLSGSYVDTGETLAQRKHNADPYTLYNQGGEPYSNPDALEALLKWKTSSAPPGENWLVRPDQAPRGQYTMREPPAAPAPGPNPDQLRLLSMGFPSELVMPQQQAPQRFTTSTGEPEMEAVLPQIDRLGSYKPGARESTNVEDRRPTTLDEHLRNLEALIPEMPSGIGRQLAEDELARARATGNIDRAVKPGAPGGGWYPHDLAR